MNIHCEGVRCWLLMNLEDVEIDPESIKKVIRHYMTQLQLIEGINLN